MAKLSTANVFSVLLASSSEGPVRADPSFARQSETNRIRMIRRRSAGPLISKLRKRELARKREIVSSIISCADGSAKRVLQYSKEWTCQLGHTKCCWTSDPGLNRKN